MGRPGGRSIKVGAANACDAMLISLKKKSLNIPFISLLFLGLQATRKTAAVQKMTKINRVGKPVSSSRQRPVDSPLRDREGAGGARVGGKVAQEVLGLAEGPDAVLACTFVSRVKKGRQQQQSRGRRREEKEEATSAYREQCRRRSAR